MSSNPFAYVPSGTAVTMISHRDQLTDHKVSALRLLERSYSQTILDTVSLAPSLNNITYLSPAILDIGGSRIDHATLQQLKSSVLRSKLLGQRVVLPDELLYDDTGLQLWSDIIHLPEYYQFHDEVSILKAHGEEIAAFIDDNAVLVDLGAGDTAKVSHLISALTRCNKRTTYLALDISKKYLGLNLEQLSIEHPDTPCRALWGTFTDGMEWITRVPSPRVFLSLGSVLCNDAYDTALKYLRSWAAILRPEDCILIGMDGHAQAAHFEKVWRSYHHDTSLPNVDEPGCTSSAGSVISMDAVSEADWSEQCIRTSSKVLTDTDSGIEIDLTPNEDPYFRRFWENGFAHANRLIGDEWFNLDDWSVRGLIEQVPTVSHRFIFRAERDVTLGSTGVIFREGEEMDWFDAHKYGPADVLKMCQLAGLQVVKVWKAPQSEMHSYLVKLATNLQT